MTTEEREVWKNDTGSTVYILVNDPFTPGIYQQQRLGKGDTIAILPSERKRNEDIAVSTKNPFKNGFLTPVQLIETAADFEHLKEQPNVRSESELIELLQVNTNKFKTEIASIDGFRVIQRLIELSETVDFEISVPKMRALEARLEELKPKANLELGDQTGDIRPQNLGSVRLN